MTAVMFTRHGWERFSERAIRREGLHAALKHGRRTFSAGCEVFFLGRREVAEARANGLDLSRHMGIHVVVDPSGTVVTTFRSQQRRRCWQRKQ